jgi:hypothetical protein
MGYGGNPTIMHETPFGALRVPYLVKQAIDWIDRMRTSSVEKGKMCINGESGQSILYVCYRKLLQRLTYCMTIPISESGVKRGEVVYKENEDSTGVKRR